MKTISMLLFVLSAMLGVVSTTPRAAAAEFKVKGRFVEKSSGEGLPAVYFKIFAEADTAKAVVNGTADLEGVFGADIVKPGKYVLKAQSIETAPLILSFTLRDAAESLDLGNVAMAPGEQELEEVTVVARKAVIASDGAKTTYNVSEDPSSTTNTVMEMLRKVPGVTVSSDGEIEVNGSSDFKIYLNGRPDPMLSSNAKDVLKAMPASALKKIEVINEPGAKYDAEGTGGILNFVTEVKQSLDGYLASFNLGYSTEQVTLSAYGRAKINKVTFDANLVYLPKFSSLEKSWSVENMKYTDSETLDYGQTDLGTRNKIAFAMGSLNLSWEPDTLNLFTLGASLQDVDGDLGLGSNYVLFGRGQAGLLQSFHRDAKGNMRFGSWGVNASYQRFLPGEGHFLVLTYMYNYDGQKIDLNNYYTDTYNYDPDNLYTLTYNNMRNNTHTAMLDYTFPFGKGNILEAGLKGVFRHNPALSYSANGESQSESKVDEAGRVDMTQFQRIGSAYASYSGSWRKWGLRAGVRYEYTRMGANFHGGDRPDFASTLSDLVPNAALTYNFAPAKNLRLAYQMRLSRPSLNEINPYNMSLIDKVVQSGNPDLSSQRINMVSLTYTNFAGRFGGNIRLSYGRLSNMITQISTVEGDILYQKMENAGSRDEVSLGGMLNWTVIPGLRLSLNADLRYLHFMVKARDLNRDGWTGNISGNANYTVKKWNFSAYGGWNAAGIRLYGNGVSYSYYGVAVSRNFLKEDRLTLTLSAQQFLNPYRNFRTVTTQPGLILESNSRQKAWQVGFSIGWRLGSLRQSVKNTRNSGAIDDASGADQGNGLMGGK